MSTATQTIDAIHFTPPAPSVRTPRIRRIAKAEWTKLRTLPSTWRTVVMAFVISVALGAILCVSQVQQWSKMTAGQRQTFDPTACSLFGIVFVGAVLIAALGVRAMTSEYVTGMIRSTFAATPNRRRVLAAKAGMIAVFVFPVALLTSMVSFEVGQRIFTGKHLAVSFAHPGVLQAVVFCALAVTLVAVMGVGLGGLIRHTAARDHDTGAGHRGRRHARSTASGRPSPVRARDRAAGRRHGEPLSWTSEARHRRCGPRYLCRNRIGGGFHPDVPGRRLNYKHRSTSTRTDHLNRLGKSMNNALRTRQRMFAVALPLTAALYIGAEGINPKGTDQLITTMAVALKVLPIAAKHHTQLYISGSITELALAAVVVSYGAIAMLIRKRGSAAATIAVLLGGIGAFCGIVVNVLAASILLPQRQPM